MKMGRKANCVDISKRQTNLRENLNMAMKGKL